jgi:hypothetical protein
VHPQTHAWPGLIRTLVLFVVCTAAVLAVALPQVALASTTSATDRVATISKAKSRKPDKRPLATKCLILTVRAFGHAHLAKVDHKRAAFHRRRATYWHQHATTCRQVLAKRRAAKTKTAAPVVVPAPGAAPRASSLAGWGGFGVGQWPGGDWRPYSDSSPFNAPISASAATVSQSAALVSSALSGGVPSALTSGTAGTQYDWGKPVYFSQPTDPIYKLHATQSWGTSSAEGAQIPIPAGAMPAGAADAHMTIVTPDGWEYDLWGASKPAAGGGTLNFQWGGRLRVDGSGVNSGVGAATASYFGNLAGMIRPEELAAGHINHALFIVLKNTASSYVYPATHTDGGTSGGVPMGTRFQLTMTDAQIAALAVPAWKKTILTALAHYGGYVGDTGGNGFGLQFQSGQTYTSLGFADPMINYAKTVGLSASNGISQWDIGSGVAWSTYLRAVTPPTAP